MRAQRGYALSIVLTAIAVSLALGAFVNVQLSNRRLVQRAEERRLQALWLARSAVLTGKAATSDVTVAGEVAHVSSRQDGTKWIGDAEFPFFGTAHVELDGSVWEERYQRAEPRPAPASQPSTALQSGDPFSVTK